MNIRVNLVYATAVTKSNESEQLIGLTYVNKLTLTCYCIVKTFLNLAQLLGVSGGDLY